MSVDEYNAMDLQDARALLAEAQIEASPIVKHIFENSDAEWLLVAGPEAEVIRWGASLANLPDTRRMIDLGHRYESAPILFTRPVEADDAEISTAGVGWRECPPGDYYPSLGVDFLGGSADTYQLHFDTGTPKTLLSYEVLVDSGVMEGAAPMDLRPGVREPSSPFQWVDRPVELVVSDGTSSRHLAVRPIVVMDWLTSPFMRRCSHGHCPGSRPGVCGRREAGMLGRDTLIEGGLAIVLDGTTRTTRFYDPGPGKAPKKFRRPLGG
jgi:hypothetical protein